MTARMSTGVDPDSVDAGADGGEAGAWCCPACFLTPTFLIVAGLSAQGEENGAAVTTVGVLVLAFVFITNWLVFLRVRAMAKKAVVATRGPH